jgi:butyrate kinase
MAENHFKIFIINPGSTSTKFSLFEDHREVFNMDVFHDSSELRKFPTINDQLDFRIKVMDTNLADHRISLEGVDAIVGRGGGCYAIPGGIYNIDQRLIDDTRAARGGLYHASMLGVQMAQVYGSRYGGRLLMMDPPIVDELQPLARITGVRGIYRRAISHALNLKAVARKHAQTLGKRYEDCRFIVCHIDGGISITAHDHGRMIDGNDAGGGQGPFTPTRMGSMAVTDVLDHLWDHDPAEVRTLCSQGGGLSSWFGTSDSTKLHKRLEAGDKVVATVWEAMIYQVTKSIGAMAAVLHGQVDAIVLTGGLLRFPEVEDRIQEACGWIAPVASYPGEMEQQAMADGAMRVLTGQEQALTYPGRPVFTGLQDL